MANLLLQILIIAYASVSVIATLGYLPTIKDLYFHKKMSVNTSSYRIWTISSCITFLYSLFILPDLLFRIVSGLNFASCILILILSLGLKNRK
jgi:hypothetical protein